MNWLEPGRKKDLVAIGILVLGISVFHGRGILPGQTFLPVDLANNNLPWRSGSPRPLQNTLISDPIYEFYPFLNYAIDTVRDTGRWPLWNPYILMGHTIIGDPNATPFYPIFVALGLILGAARALAAGLWLHAVLAGVFTYGLLRALGCRRYAAATGALVYSLGGYMVTWFWATHWVVTLSWLPGVLWAYELAIQRRSPLFTGLAALALAMAALGGQFQFIVTFGLFLGFYAIGRTVEEARHGTKAYAWPLLSFTVVAGLAALLGAVQTLPFAEYLNLSHRVLPSGLRDALPPLQLVTLAVADFFGNPTSPGGYWGALNYSEGTVYAGASALLLACLAPFWARRFFVTYLSVGALALLYFILGGPGIEVFGSLPVLKYASLHRSAFLLPLFVAILAGLSLSTDAAPVRAAWVIVCVLMAAVGFAMYLSWAQRLMEDLQSVGRPLLHTALFLILTVVALSVRARFPGLRGAAEGSLVLIVFLDLYLIGHRFNPAGPVSELMPSTPAIEYLREHDGSHRVAAYQLGDVVFGPNVLSIYGIAEPGGYSSVVPDRLRRLVKAGDPTVDVWWMDENAGMVAFSHPSRRLLDLLQVGYVVSPLPLFDRGIRAELVAEGCDGVSAEIVGGSAVSGTFEVQDTAINRLDLRFRAGGTGEPSGQLTVRMWEGAGRERQMLEAQLDASQVLDDRPVTLYFAAENDAPGKTYAWQIDAGDAASSTGIGLCTTSAGQPAVSVYGADWEPVHEGRVFIYKRLAPQPRAYVVYSAEHIADDSPTVDRLLDESFDVRNSAVTAKPLRLPDSSGRAASAADIVSYEGSRVVVDAAAEEAGLLVLGDQYHPGWRASVDGQPVEVLRVNLVMRGVLVPEGEHQVVFEFAPDSLRIGLSLSLVGILLLAALIALDRHPAIARWLHRENQREGHSQPPGEPGEPGESG